MRSIKSATLTRGSVAPSSISKPIVITASSQFMPSRLASPRLAAISYPDVDVVPDSVRRQLENEARRAAFEAERLAERAAEESGQNWWEVDCPPNMVNVQNLAHLQQAVEKANAAGQLAVVNFFAADCYACKSMQPKLRQIARDNPGVLFCKLNGAGSDELKQYCEDMELTRIPYFHFYVDGKRVAHFSANMRPDKLKLLRSTIQQHSQPQSQLLPQ